jgi:hypothetical protein
MPAVVGADVPVADVVAHDDEDIGLGRRLRTGRKSCRKAGKQRGRRKQFVERSLDHWLAPVREIEDIPLLKFERINHFPVVLHVDDGPFTTDRLVPRLVEPADGEFRS